MITVSDGSRRDIVRLWPELEHKLHVIPNGVGAAYLNAAPAPLSPTLQAVGVRRPYLLYVGGEVPRKRLDWAIQTLAGLKDARVSLVICGTERATRARILEKVNPALRSRLCFAPFLDELEMPALYMNAVAVLYPTKYEGFGLPALEAQAVGTPVLCSDVNGLSELKGPGAEVLPVDDLRAWIATAKKLVSQRIEAPHPNEHARAWAARFSWDVCAARTCQVYEWALSVIQPRRRVNSIVQPSQE